MRNTHPLQVNLKSPDDNRPISLEETIKLLQSTVSKAAVRIPLYEALYAGSSSIKDIADFRRLPLLNKCTFEELADVGKTVADPMDMLGSYAPWNMEKRHFPLPILHDEHDEKKVIERLSWITRVIGLAQSERITFLVSSQYQYGVAELVDLLIYLGFQCQIIHVTNQSAYDVNIMLIESDSSILFFAAEQKYMESGIPECIKTLISFNHPEKVNGEFEHFDILHPDEIPLLAISKRPNSYSWLPNHFFIEESTRNTLVLTALDHSFQPFIRYDTGIKAQIEEYKFCLLDE